MHIQILLVAIVVALCIYVACRLKSRNRYGGHQQDCEDLCFSSEYYGACLDACMDPIGFSGFRAHGPPELELQGLEASVPLESETPDTVYYSTKAGPYRYDYPGH